MVAGDPFATVATDPARYLVTFLAEPPDPGRVDALPPAEGGGDYLVRGRELYLWLPDGIAEHAAGLLEVGPAARPSPGRRATGTPSSGSRSWPADRAPPRASPVRGDTRRRRFGSVPADAIRNCSAGHRPGGLSCKGTPRDRAGGRADLAVRVPSAGHRRAHWALRDVAELPRVRAELRRHATTARRCRRPRPARPADPGPRRDGLQRPAPRRRRGRGHRPAHRRRLPDGGVRLGDRRRRRRRRSGGTRARAGSGCT